MHVAIIGVTGYAGSILFELLKKHVAVSKINLYGHDLKKATLLSEIAPLFSSEQKLVLPYDSSTIIQNNAVAFFATPAGVTSKLAQPYLAKQFPVIDLSGDFRLRSALDYEKWYHKPSADKLSLAKSFYGLADIYNCKGHTYIANPGCYATSVLLGLAPLVQKDLIDLDSIIIDAKSGLSGAGKQLSASSHFVMANENLKVYKPNQHKHIPEIVQTMQGWNPSVHHIEFMTTLVPLNKGIMSNIYVKLKPNINFSEVQFAFDTLYHDSLFVHVMKNQLPMLKSVIGTNECHIGLSFNPENNFLLINSVIDNMLKGAAGQAVQNFNQMFNLPENTGLDLNPVLL